MRARKAVACHKEFCCFSSWIIDLIEMVPKETTRSIDFSQIDSTSDQDDQNCHSSTRNKEKERRPWNCRSSRNLLLSIDVSIRIRLTTTTSNSKTQISIHPRFQNQWNDALRPQLHSDRWFMRQVLGCSYLVFEEFHWVLFRSYPKLPCST